MNYELWSIIIVCVSAAGIVAQTVYHVITRRRAQKLGIMRVKYPVWNGVTALSAFVAVMGIFLIIILCADAIPRDLADLANYRAWLPDDPEYYTRCIEKTETSLARNRFQLVFCISYTAIELLTIFTSGAYITRDGVLFFGGMKPKKTAARIEFGAINFYVGKKRQTYAFDLSDNEENRALFSGFLSSQPQNYY